MAKESLQSLDKNLIFRETFNSFSDIAKNGGVISGNPTLSNGVIALDGTEDFLTYNKILDSLKGSTIGSIRIKLKLTNVTNTQEIISFGDTDADTRIQFDNSGNGILRALVGVSGTTQWATDTDSTALANNTWVDLVLTQNATSPVLYVNGTAPAQAFSTTTDKTYWFSKISGIDNVKIGAGSWNNSGNANLMTGSIEFVEFYNKALSSSEVSALYKNSLYRKPATNSEVLNISSLNGIIQDKYSNTITNVATTIVKDNANVMDFNGTTSKLTITDTASLRPLTSAYTVAFWIKTKITSWPNYVIQKGATSIDGWCVNGRAGGILDAIQYDVYASAARERYSTAAINDGKWHRCVVVFAFNTFPDCYIDGALSNSTTYQIGNITTIDNTSNLVINTNADLKIRLGDIQYFMRALSAEEIARDYNSTKQYYG